MSFQSEINVLPAEQWLQESSAGDMLLCDPFNGRPLTEDPFYLSPSMPTSAFMEDLTLRDGSTYLARAARFGLQRIGVYLTDPSSPEGLGDQEELDEAFRSHDAVGYTSERSVRFSKRPGDVAGGLAVGAEVSASNGYNERLLDVLGRHNNHVFDIGVPCDPINLAPTTQAGRALRVARDMVVAEGISQAGSGNPDLVYMGMDMVHANTLQWHQALRTGCGLESTLAEYGRMPESVLLVVPVEHSDLARKIGAVTSVEVRCNPARESFGSNQDYVNYMEILEQGYVPHDRIGKPQ
ncbi:MAG TPA: hypothetical protein VLA92_00550 [Candidatus Saccharimonadales bacterium]|nr:hypothetical protein [Candidatus Saccharimonadales bacterium]